MNTEVLATTKVQGILAALPRVTPFIHEGDKEPSWDGNIYLCSDNNCSKKGISKIPAQVKGHWAEGNGFLEISYSIDVVDLENYYRNGGCLYFVVYISPENPRNKTIFYRALHPYDLRLLLQKKGGQGSISVKLRRFPDNQIEELNILMRFTQDSALQSSLPTISDDNFAKICDFNSANARLSMSYTILSNNYWDSFFNLTDIYQYRDTGFGIKVPVSKVDKFTSAEIKISLPVICDGRIFFESFQFCRKCDIYQIKIGIGISIIINEKAKSKTLNYTQNGTLAQQIADIECFHAIIQSQKVTFGELVMDMSVTQSNPNVMQESMEKLEFLKTLQEAFIAAGYKGDVRINEFSNEDWEKSQVLISAFIDKKSLFKRKKDGVEFFCFTIGNASLLLLISQNGKNKQVLNPYDPLLRVEIKSDHGDIPISPYCLLNEENLRAVSKFDFDSVMNSIKRFPFCAEYYYHLVQMLLRMLRVSDSGAKDPDMLIYCEQLASWLVAQNKESIIDKINLYQVFKRQRDLSPEDISSLHTFLELPGISDDQMAGIYILLSDWHNFSAHFNKLVDEKKAEFKNYPIFNLLPDNWR